MRFDSSALRSAVLVAIVGVALASSAFAEHRIVSFASTETLGGLSLGAGDLVGRYGSDDNPLTNFDALALDESLTGP